MPVSSHTFASDPPAPPAIAVGRPAPERAAVRAAASPAEAERLGDRIAELASRIYAATYELLVLIQQFDAAGAWSGFASCAVWLSWRTGLEPGAAREHVRVAHALAQLPKVSDAMRRGRVSYSKVRAITRVATPETEQSLLDVALAGTAAQVERVVRAWRRVDRAAEADDDRAQQTGRTLHTWVDDDGMVVVRGRLTPEVGSAFRRALEAAVAADGGATGAGGKERTTDAVDEAVGVERSHGQRQADALGRLAECALAGGLDRGTAGDRYQVVLHVDAETLAEDAAPDAREHAADGDAPQERAADGGDPHGDVPAGTRLEAAPTSGGAAGSEHAGASNPDADGEDAHRDVPAGTRGAVRRVAASCPGPRAGRRQAALAEDGGIRVGQETARRIACDAATVTMRHGADGGVLDVGRRTRTISPALRRALAARDGKCRFPGCAARRCDAHHVRHWADGGETALANLVLLCRRHHRAVHEDGFRVQVDAGGAVTFVRPDGRPLPQAPAPPHWDGSALAPVDRRLGAAGIGIDARTAPRWQGERLDLGWAIDVLWRPRTKAAPAAGVPAGTPGPSARPHDGTASTTSAADAFAGAPGP
ncbi:MAG: DUF222 domain-containing protein [Acidobacteria bacterium]|nr:DUF222 domain-containing protein [Acidobacteriota bacterium]